VSARPVTYGHRAAARKAGVSVSDWLRACAVELGLAHH